MLLTPWGYRGLYIPNDDRYPAHFRGMGIRIEDSVCVEEEHPLVLTTEAVKEVCNVRSISREDRADNNLFHLGR